MKPQVRFVITDTYMGLSHDGLCEVIRLMKKKNPLFAKTMQIEGGLILFVNKARTKAKLLSESGNVFAYLRIPGDRRLTEESLDELPASFGGSVEYAKAAKTALKNLLQIEKSNRVSPISKALLAS